MKNILYILFLLPFISNSQKQSNRNFFNIGLMGDLKSPIGFSIGNNKGTVFFLGTLKGFGKPDYTNIISPTTPTTVFGDRSLGRYSERFVLGYLRSVSFKKNSNIYFDFGGGLGDIIYKQTYYDATGILSPNYTYIVGDNKDEIEAGAIMGLSYFSKSIKYNLDICEYSKVGFTVMLGIGFLMFK